MAQQKMHAALLRNHTSIGKLLERSNSSSTQSLGEDKPSIKVNETSFFIWEGTTKCAYVVYLTFGPDGQWTRILSLPSECFDICRGLRDMDGLCVVSRTPIIPFSEDYPKYLRSIWHKYSADQVAETKFLGNVTFRQRCSQQKTLTNKCVKPNENPCCCSMWSDIMSGVTDATCVSENSKVPRKKSKKKTKKKKKQSKKFNSDAGLVGDEAISNPFINNSSTTEPFDAYDMELDGQAPSNFDLGNSLSDMCDTQAVRENISSAPSRLVKPSPCFMDLDLDTSHRSCNQAFATEVIEAAKDGLRQQIDWFECDTEVSYGKHDSVVSDSDFSCLNSIESRDTICDVTNITHYISTETSAFVGKSVSAESSSIVSLEFGTQTTGRQFSSKRGNYTEVMPGRCTYKRNSHGQFGKENIRSIWKKVQNTDSNRAYTLEKNNNMSSEFSVISREMPHHEGYCNVATKASAASGINNFQVKFSQRPRNSIATESQDSQQKGNSPCRKKYYPKKDGHSMLLKANQEKGRNFIETAQKIIKQGRVPDSRYHTLSNSSRLELRNNQVNCIPSTSVPAMKVHPEDILIPKIILNTNDEKIYYRNSEVRHSLPTESDVSVSCFDQIQQGLPVLNEDDIHIKKDASFAKNGKRDCSNSGIFLQKWIPVGRKDPCPTGLERSDTSLLLHFDNPETVNGCCKTNTDLSCDTTPSTISEVQDPYPNFDKLQVEKLTIETTIMPDSRKFGSLISGVKEVPTSSSDVFLKNIISAIEDSFRVQVESEVVQVDTRNPIPGFEKFLHSACPVILELDGSLKCQLCHLEPASISFLCTHELPCVSLRSVWGWYERHGSYGLEVREHKYDDPALLGYREFGLRAYFVPYLSAVQLFKKCRNGYVKNLECLRPECSLHPCCKSVDNNILDHSALTTGSYELIFEYFESEQPRRRQPLFDKIQELAKGMGSQQQVYGDPSMLTSSDLCDIHPRSWYSVAWYPIYKIPDGNFRAAFLTYHSLGCLVHKDASLNSSQVEALSPVVGLLSCNAQCEGWFHHLETHKFPDTTKSSLSETTKERLRTLEYTAGVLATSTVRKGSIATVNRHPDYEFFKSRRR